jgi:sugar lactone lactonase YvrE
MIDHVTISNGLVWSLDHSTMYYIDSPAQTVTAFDYDIETGDIGNGQVVIQVPPEMGFPDGMAIDTEGMLWIAHYNGWCVRRWHPDTGDVLETIKLPTSRITACAFGGKNLDTLFITSATENMSNEQLKKEPLAGALFMAKPGFQGLKAFRFRG